MLSSILFKISRSFLISFVFVINIAVAQTSNPIVKTNKGYIRGVQEEGISVFKGVPYAAPPVGELRFMPPVTHQHWKDTLSATQFGAIATQINGNKVVGSEDCLTLNVYTPQADHRKRAVLVWVHGGSMTGGAGKGEDGHAFADRDDIVTVTINYRLGAFGFMYLGDVNKRYAQSGNNGMLDCIMALRWVHDNIEALGGDPNRVTLMGESAGAKLISAVLVSPLSKGLFQQYIAESGSVQCIRDTVTAKNERKRILHDMKMQDSDARKLLTLSADTIIKAQSRACAGIGGNSFFGPVYDGVAIREDAYQYAASKSFPAIKALIGTNKYEAALFVKPEVDIAHFNEVVLEPLFANNAPIVNTWYQQLHKTKAPYAAVVESLTQYMYQMHSYRFARVLAQRGIPVWMYRYDYNNGAEFGAAHAQELQYVWHKPGNGVNTTDAAKSQLARNMHGAWVAFIKTGNPGIASLPAWPVYKDNTREVMIFDTTNKVKALDEVYDDKRFPSAVFVIN